MAEQVGHRRTVQLDVLQRRVQALDAALADIEAQLKAADLLEGFLGQSAEQVKAIHVDEQELVLEREVFLQVAIATEGIQRIGNQRLVFGEPHRLHPLARQAERHRLAGHAIQRPPMGVQRNQLDALQVAQQAQIEHLADVALAGQVQAQPTQAQLAEMPVAVHRQAQAEQRTLAGHRIVERLQHQRQDFGGVAGTEATGDLAHQQALDRRIALHAQRPARAGQGVELENAESRQRAHIVRPQQVHHRVAEFRQLVVQLLPQPPGQEGKALEQALDIRIASDLPEKRGQGRATLGETAPQLAQCGEFALVVMIEGHGLPAGYRFTDGSRLTAAAKTAMTFLA